jgi:hypothetical protein
VDPAPTTWYSSNFLLATSLAARVGPLRTYSATAARDPPLRDLLLLRWHLEACAQRPAVLTEAARNVAVPAPQRPRSRLPAARPPGDGTHPPPPLPSRYARRRRRDQATQIQGIAPGRPQLASTPIHGGQL